MFVYVLVVPSKVLNELDWVKTKKVPLLTWLASQFGNRYLWFYLLSPLPLSGYTLVIPNTLVRFVE